MRFIYLLFLLPFTASAQCDPEGILLELQATTDLNGLLFGETGCIEAVTIGSPLTFTGGTLDITTGNLTAGSTKVAVTGGTGAVIGSGSTVDVVPGNILLSTLGGTLNLSQINQGGATLNQVMQWNGTTWAPATATATTDLTFSGASSPVTLNSSTGTDVTHTAGTGISLTGTSSNMTITNTAPDQTVSITGAGISVVTGTYPNFTITSTEVDGSTTNELQTYGHSGTTSYTNTLSNSGGSFTLQAGGINAISHTAGTVTITATEVDGSTTNELQTYGHAGTTTYTNTLSGGGGSWSITGAGIAAISQTGGAITVTATEVDGSISNEGILGVGAGGASSSTITTTTSTGNAVTINAAGILAISESTSANGGSITLTATEVDGSTTNELQTIANTSDATSHTVTLSNSGGSFQLVEGSGVTLTTTGTSGAGVVTIAATGAGTDLTFSGASSPVTLNSSTGTDVTYTAGTGISLSASSSNLTVTNSAPDQTVSITNGGGVSVSGTYPNFTLTATDASATNEAQTLSVSGTTSGILSLNAISGVGGGTATIAAGTGITVAQSAGTITITNSSPATAGWLLGGNTIGSAKRIGSNDNFDVVVETNGTDRMWFDNGGAVSIGTTQSTAAQLVIKGLLSSNGVLIDAGGTLTGPTFYAATGSGSGSNATVLSGVVSMLNGNVEGLFKNTSATGTGGALLTLNTHQSATGDPKVVWTTNDVTTWAAGIDNSISGEPWKLTPNSDIGAATPAISSTTANKVGINQAAAVVTLQVTGTDAIGLPTGTTAQRSAAAIPQIRHNNTFSGLEFYDQNKGYWYRLTAISTPTVVSNTAAGTGHSGNVLAGELSSDVRGVLELNTGSASTAVGTVMTVTYASAYSGTKTVVLLDAGNDIATTQRNRFRVDTQSNTGFTIRAVTALDINETYVIKYYVGQ